jgi:hypothetical protein
MLASAVAVMLQCLSKRVFTIHWVLIRSDGMIYLSNCHGGNCSKLDD